jgi:hypothetical protein
MVFVASRGCETWHAPISEERMLNVIEAMVLIKICENKTGRNTNMEKIT